MCAPWPYDDSCHQGPTPGSPNFREIFPSGVSPLRQDERAADAECAFRGGNEALVGEAASMPPGMETPPWRGRRSEVRFANNGDTAENGPSSESGQGPADPLRILRTHWAADLPPPYRQIGDVALGVVAGLERQLDKVGGGR